MKICLTFDIEDWYHANYGEVRLLSASNRRSNFPQNVQRLIDLCARLRIHATCFILGEMAERYPQIVRDLQASGHEIASHGHCHKLVYSMTPLEFKEDVRRSCGVIEGITGSKIIGFRAPSWSVKRENLGWYYDTLEALGLRYSSSIYPASTFLYGIEDFPELAGYPEIEGRRTTIFEIPVPVTRILHRNVGYSGGFYLRLFPAFFIKGRLNRALASGLTPFVYLHPREIDLDQPRLKLSPLNRIIHYWGIRGCESKLEQVLSGYPDRIQTFRELLSSGLPDEYPKLI